MSKEKNNKIKKNRRKKLTRIDYISTVVGCFITFFVATYALRIIEKEVLPIFSDMVFTVMGGAFLSAIIAIIISLISRHPIVGIGISSFLFINSFLYIALRDIHQLPPSEASTFSTIGFLVVTITGWGLCLLIKKILILERRKKILKK